MDLGVGKAIEDWLESQGHDVLCVSDLDPTMPDTDILDRANVEQRLVVTMDKDFGELVYRCRQGHAGVLRLRLDEARIAEKLAIVEAVSGVYCGVPPPSVVPEQATRLTALLRQGGLLGPSLSAGDTRCSRDDRTPRLRKAILQRQDGRLLLLGGLFAERQGSYQLRPAGGLARRIAGTAFVIRPTRTLLYRAVLAYRGDCRLSRYLNMNPLLIELKSISSIFLFM